MDIKHYTFPSEEGLSNFLVTYYLSSSFIHVSILPLLHVFSYVVYNMRRLVCGLAKFVGGARLCLYSCDEIWEYNNQFNFSSLQNELCILNINILSLMLSSSQLAFSLWIFDLSSSLKFRNVCQKQNILSLAFPSQK